MKNFEDLIKDIPTFERICKIVQGLFEDRILLDYEFDYGYIGCHIGKCYFMIKDKKYPEIKRIEKNKNVFFLAQIILKSIIDLESTEYIYCCDMLEF